MMIGQIRSQTARIVSLELQQTCFTSCVSFCSIETLLHVKFGLALDVCISSEDTPIAIEIEYQELKGNYVYFNSLPILAAVIDLEGRHARDLESYIAESFLRWLFA